MENRILIHAPHGRDAQVVEGVLQAHGLATHICGDEAALLAALQQESAATVVTEESLTQGLDGALGTYLATQPPWSDYPFVVLATRQAGRRSKQALATLQELGNLVLLERPVNPETLASAARSALRARRRQYGTRRHLADLELSKQAVDQANSALESRIAERTVDLASANDRLMREIAERERVQNSVVQGQKMEAIGQLTGGIAHDFNNLLHVVNMNLQLIERLAVNERVRDHAVRAKDAVGRGSRLTAQLLSFARSQSLVPRLHDVHALVRNMSELIAVSVGSKVALSLELPPEPAYAMLDAAQLEMAILNMAVNSRDAMPDGGRLAVRSARAQMAPQGGGAPQDCIEISVADTGSGIPPSLLSKVFDPFFTTKPVGSGTGLGLSQVYGFAQQSGGSAELRSTVGEGTTVLLRFPLASQAPEAAGGPAPAAAGGRQQAEVLVVEDDAGVRQSIVECLHILGYSVREACNGLEGLEALRKARPDLLMVDYLMPAMNGAELITQARALHADLPILLATGYADMARVQGLIGRHAVLAKPFDLETLGQAVAGALGGSRTVAAAA